MARRDIAALLEARGPEIMGRFWKCVEKTEGCWNWTGSRQRRRDGSLWYGRFCIGHGKCYLAHHVSWIDANGPIDDVLVLRHTCDNPACVRPSHLVPGTQAENLDDMRQRGRAFTEFGRHGSEHHCSKIGPDEARKIVALRIDGLSLTKIGADVGLDQSTVHDIVHGRTWAHATGIERVEPKPAKRIMVTFGGETKPLRAWCTELQIKYGTVHGRVKRGWDPTESIHESLRRKGAA